jgi:hypothetical protein
MLRYVATAAAQPLARTARRVHWFSTICLNIQASINPRLIEI